MKSKIAHKILITLFKVIIAFLILYTQPLSIFSQEKKENINLNRFDKEKWKNEKEKLQQYKTGERKEVNPRSLDKKKWEDLKEELEYETKKKKKKQKEEDKEFDSSFLDALLLLLKPLGYFFLILIAIALLWFIIFLIKNFKGKNKKVDNFPKITFEKLEEAEENLERADFTKLLEEALQDENYLVALRIYYLIVLQKLNENKYIVWEKKKTNRIYAEELKGNNYYQQFLQLTNSFDFFWYGNKEVPIDTFSELESLFQKMITELDVTEEK